MCIPVISCAQIHKFERQVDVMSSKEKPKKITVVATDGKRCGSLGDCRFARLSRPPIVAWCITRRASPFRRYNFLCKRERRGDLRKDTRLMECASLVNRLLAKDGAGVRTHNANELALRDSVPNLPAMRAQRRRKLRLRAYSVVCLNEGTN